MEKPKQIITYIAIKNNLDWDKTYEDIRTKNIPCNKDIKEYCKTHDFSNVVYILDQEYPNVLKNTRKPPFVLFYEGDLTALNNLEDTLYFTALNNNFKVNFNNLILVGKDDKGYYISVKGILKLRTTDSVIEAVRVAMVLANKIVITQYNDNEINAIRIGVARALETGKDIYCQPTSEVGTLNNRLIKEGAYLAETEQDLL